MWHPLGCIWHASVEPCSKWGVRASDPGYISSDVHISRISFAMFVVGWVVHVVQSMWDFRPEILDWVQIRWQSRPIHVLHILIFEEIHDVTRSVCWSIAILEHKICLEVSSIKWKYLGFQDTYVLVLIHISIQFMELKFPSATEVALIVTSPPPACTLGSCHRNINKTDPVGTELRWRFCSTITA